MEAKELRIGNLVISNELACNCKTDKVLEISAIGIDLDFTNGTTQNYVGIKPIPLTEEWLLNVGFLEDEKYDNTYCKYLSVLNGFTTMEYDLDNNLLLLDNMEIKIKHVHQLQNLYFALTQTELEIQK